MEIERAVSEAGCTVAEGYMMQYQELAPIQKEQLLHQSYLNTAQICLAVWTENPGRYFRRSLRRQIHQNYIVITSPDDIPQGCAGIVIAIEDIDCMSVTLMQYASALSMGADFVYSNALFGPSGEILCTPTAERCGIAVVSVDLFYQALSSEKEKMPSSVLRYAAQKAQVRRCLPDALIHYRRDPQLKDLFAAERKRALLLTHEYSMTGAPIVLSSVALTLEEHGYDVAVLGPAPAGAQKLFETKGAYILYCQHGLEETGLYSIAEHCDVIILNTVVGAKLLPKLNGLPVPVLWWLHDAQQVYYGIAPELPKRLENNVRVYAVGTRAGRAIIQLRPQFKVRELLYGLPDYALDKPVKLDLSFAEDKVLFVAIGTIEWRKGTDILCKAISLAQTRALEDAIFLFVGRNQDDKLFDGLCSLIEAFPGQVQYREQLNRAEIKTLIRRADCMVRSEERR